MLLAMTNDTPSHSHGAMRLRGASIRSPKKGKGAGKRRVPAAEQMSDQEIDSIIAYLAHMAARHSGTP